MVLDNSYFLIYTHFHKYINYLIGIWFSAFAVAGGLLLAATMVGAFLTHVMRKDSFSHMLPVIVLFVLIVIILVVRLPQTMGGLL